MSHDWPMMTLERRRDLITVLEPYFLPKRLHSIKSFFIKAIDHTFYGFTGVITHLGCWENRRKACKSRAELLVEWGLLGKKYGSSTVTKSRLLSKVIISQSRLTI